MNVPLRRGTARRLGLQSLPMHFLRMPYPVTPEHARQIKEMFRRSRNPVGVVVLSG